ncbi:MAG: hypothetical protein L0Y60_11550 [Beijerinckiaceae bacterium]|nr:hypothetical protein [Beijerinckiaceae bacterium]
MPPLTIFLSRLIGLLCLGLSLAMAMRHRSFAETAGLLIHDRPLLLMLGLITLTAGLALVLAHNIWSGGALPIVVTLIGWITLIRGIVLLLVPPEVLASFVETIDIERHFYVPAAITFVLGFYLTYMGFKLARR